MLERFARRIGLDPGIAGDARDPVLRSRVLVFMFASGGLTSLVALMFASSLPIHAGSMAAAAAGGVALGLGAAIVGRRISDGWLHLFTLGGTALVSLGAYGTAELPFGAAIFYIWVAVITAYFLPTRAAFAHVGVMAVAYGTVLLIVHTPGSALGRWVVVVSTLVVFATVINGLKRLIQTRVEELETSRAELARSNSLLQATLDATADAICVVDNDGQVVSYNQRLLRMWRIPGELVERGEFAGFADFIRGMLEDPGALGPVVAPDADSERNADHYAVLRLADGRTVELNSRPRVSSAGERLGRVLSFRDISERERVQSQLRHMAHHDALTGLMNRRRFEEELDRHLVRTDPDSPSGVVIMLDLDEFKYVNDTLGHRAGDAVLVHIAEILSDRLRESDAIARLGGDEFAILLPGIDEGEANEVAAEIVTAVRRTFTTYRDRPVRVTVSAGVASASGTESSSAEAVMIRAGLAMYEAKDAGRDRVVASTGAAPPMGGIHSARTWAERIRAALDEGGFVLQAQPIYDLSARAVTQFEVLIRMLDEDGSLLPPGRFLPAAERSGLITDIDLWVVREAAQRIAASPGGEELCLEVNLSGRTIGNSELPAQIETVILEAGISPASLVFEVTETAAVRNLEEARRFAARIRDFGCRVALDDFGAGFGSFYYLKYLPFDYLKIDGDFISNLSTSDTDQAVVRAIVDLARGLGKKTIAEFVADEPTMLMLQGLGVDFAQGNHIGRPRSLDWVGVDDDAPLNARLDPAG